MTQPNSAIFLAPSAPGQLTNKRGSTANGADDIVVGARYSNPRATADLPNSARVMLTRIGVGGILTSPTLFQDTQWQGAPAYSAMPLAPGGSQQFYPNSSAVYNKRVYVVNGIGGSAGTDIWSSPMAGANQGTWRFESKPPKSVFAAADDNTARRTTMCIVNGFLYISETGAGANAGGNAVYMAPILGDGTLGGWTRLAAPVTTAVAAEAAILVGYGDSTAAWLLWLNATSSYTAPVNADGTIGAWTATTALPAATVAQAGAVYDRFNAKLYVIGAGAPASLTIAAAAVTAGTGALGAFANNATGLPAARSMFGMGLIGDFVNTATASVYVVGGGSAAAGATPQTTVYSITTANLALGNVAWTTGTALGAAVSKQAAWGTAETHADTLAGAATYHIQTMGVTGASSIPTQGAPAQLPGNSAFVTGAAAALASAPPYFTITTNQDGTVDLSMIALYANTGLLVTGGFADGDIVQLTIQWTDQQNGDASIPANTIFRVGQAPSTTNRLPGAAITTAQPTASFNFNAGAGGGPMAWWQVKVTDPNGLVVFDTGRRRDSAFSALINPAPLLATATAYTFAWTVTSTDDVFNGATNTKTDTLVVTPTVTAPGTPTGLSAVADSANGLILLTWTNPAPPATSGNRVYYRLNGSMSWRLYADLIGPVASLIMLDKLALSRGYDFLVTQVDRTAGAFAESSSGSISDNFELSAASTATLWHSLGTEAGTDNSINYWTTLAGAPAFASHLLSLPAGALIRGGHLDWWDVTQTVRFQWATGGTADLRVHLTDGNNWIRGYCDGVNIVIQKTVGGVASGSLAQAAAALVNGTFYWLRVQASGTTYTATIFNDSAGAIGSQIATCNFTITDAVLQTGALALGAAGATINFGGAFANVCTVTGPRPQSLGSTWNPTVGAGEPAFCWSKNNPFSGTYSLSIYTPSVNGYGYWQLGTGPAVQSGTQYTISVRVRGPVVGPFTGNVFVSGGADNFNSAWGLTGSWVGQTMSFTPTSGYNASILLRDGAGAAAAAGTYYFDDVTLLPSGGFNKQIDGSTYGCFLHLAGLGQTYKIASSLKGLPSFPAKIDAALTKRFGLVAPTIRYGVLNYNELNFEIFLSGLSQFQALVALLLYAQLNGAVIYYRDGMGAMFTCGIDPAQGPVTYKQPAYRFVALKLIQIPDLQGPYVSQGSAAGFPTLANGAIPALDQAELLI